MIDKIFLEHPRNVGQSYMEHQGFALAMSARLFVAAFASLIHAFIPALFTTTGSNIVYQIHSTIRGRMRIMAKQHPWSE